MCYSRLYASEAGVVGMRKCRVLWRRGAQHTTRNGPDSRNAPECTSIGKIGVGSCDDYRLFRTPFGNCTLSGSALRAASFLFATLPVSPSVYIDHLLFPLFPRSWATAPPLQTTVSPFQGSPWVYRTAPSHKVKVAAISTEQASEDGYAGTEVHEYAYACMEAS